jgi:hypothetical protein
MIHVRNVKITETKVITTYFVHPSVLHEEVISFQPTLDGKLPFSVDKTLVYSLTKGIFYPPCFIM